MAEFKSSLDKSSIIMSMKEIENFKDEIYLNNHEFRILSWDQVNSQPYLLVKNYNTWGFMNIRGARGKQFNRDNMIYISTISGRESLAKAHACGLEILFFKRTLDMWANIMIWTDFDSLVY